MKMRYGYGEITYYELIPVLLALQSLLRIFGLFCARLTLHPEDGGRKSNRNAHISVSGNMI
jgi:hypothetical protein